MVKQPIKCLILLPPPWSTAAMAAGCNPFDQQRACRGSPGGKCVVWPWSPDLHCNLSRSLLQLTFPGKYQLWPPAGLELKGSSANLTGSVRYHLDGRRREPGQQKECLSALMPASSHAKQTEFPFNYPAVGRVSMLIGQRLVKVYWGQQWQKRSWVECGPKKMVVGLTGCLAISVQWWKKQRPGRWA